MIVAKRIVLHFTRRLVDQPIVYRLVKDYDLEFNILKASITDSEGFTVMELKGEQENYDKGIEYLVRSGVKIQALSQDVSRNESRCTACGACVVICPTGAFEVDPETKKINFHNEFCVACGVCIKACPPRAIELHF